MFQKLYLEKLEDRNTPASLQFVNVPYNTAGIPQVEKIGIRWDEPVIDFNIDDVNLYKNGELVSKGLMNVVSAGDDRNFTVVGLLGAAFGNGQYTLKIESKDVKQQLADEIFSLEDVSYSYNWTQISGSTSSFGADWYGFGVLNIPEKAKTQVISVASGANHGIALRNDGSVATWGSVEASLELPPFEYDPKNPVVQIAASAEACAVLRKNGSVTVWGSSNINLPQANAVSISLQSNLLILNNDGTVVSYNLDQNYSNTLSVTVTNAVDVTSGKELHSILKADGTVYNWGYDKVDSNTLVPPDGFITEVAAGSNNILYTIDNRYVKVSGQTNYLAEDIKARAERVYSPAKLVANSNFASVIDASGNLISNFNDGVKYDKAGNIIDSSNGLAHSLIVSNNLGSRRMPGSWLAKVHVARNS